MKENVLDILMYLFENYIDDEVNIQPDKETLSSELQEAGFPLSEVNKALTWLEGLTKLQGAEGLPIPANNNSIRVFAEQEKKKLSLECRSFLLFLDNLGAFDRNVRELIIDRVMALETTEIDLEQLKWVILLVLFNQPSQEAAFAWIEDVVFEEVACSIH